MIILVCFLNEEVLLAKTAALIHAVLDVRAIYGPVVIVAARAYTPLIVLEVRTLARGHTLSQIHL